MKLKGKQKLLYSLANQTGSAVEYIRKATQIKGLKIKDIIGMLSNEDIDLVLPKIRKLIKENI